MEVVPFLAAGLSQQTWLALHSSSLLASSDQTTCQRCVLMIGLDSQEDILLPPLSTDILLLASANPMAKQSHK